MRSRCVEGVGAPPRRGARARCRALLLARSARSVASSLSLVCSPCFAAAACSRFALLAPSLLRSLCRPPARAPFDCANGGGLRLPPRRTQRAPRARLWRACALINIKKYRNRLEFTKLFTTFAPELVTIPFTMWAKSFVHHG